MSNNETCMIKPANYDKFRRDGYTHEFECTGCGETIYVFAGAIKCNYNFCPWCGRKVIRKITDLN